MISRNSMSVVGYFDHRRSATRFHPDRDLSVLFDGLECVEQEVQDYLMNLIAIVLDFGQRRISVQGDLDCLGKALLPTQHDGVLHSNIEIALANLGRVGSCCL